MKFVICFLMHASTHALHTNTHASLFLSQDLLDPDPCPKRHIMRCWATTWPWTIKETDYSTSCMLRVYWMHCMGRLARSTPGWQGCCCYCCCCMLHAAVTTAAAHTSTQAYTHTHNVESCDTKEIIRVKAILYQHYNIGIKIAEKQAT